MPLLRNGLLLLLLLQLLLLLLLLQHVLVLEYGLPLHVVRPSLVVRCLLLAAWVRHRHVIPVAARTTTGSTGSTTTSASMGVVRVLVHEAVVDSGCTRRRRPVRHEAVRGPKPVRPKAVHAVTPVLARIPCHALEGRVPLAPLGDLRQHFRGRGVVPEEPVAVNLWCANRQNKFNQS